MEIQQPFCCPVCGGPLKKQGGALVCPARHSFDIAAKGYAHLLPSSRMHAKVPGDDRDMVAARRAFLDSGAYEPFQKALAGLVLEYTAGVPRPFVLDAGCGEGYYTAAVAKALREAGREGCVAGFDISKFAVKAAAGRDKQVFWAVAGSFAIPVESGAVHCLLNVFSPMVETEFARVLAPGGVLLYAVPGPRHLFGLKQVLYDTPYENPVSDTAYKGFVLERRVPVRDCITLRGEQIGRLFQMTPYYWKTPRAGAARLAACTELSTEIEFDFLVYRRTQKQTGERQKSGKIDKRNPLVSE